MRLDPVQRRSSSPEKPEDEDLAPEVASAPGVRPAYRGSSVIRAGDLLSHEEMQLSQRMLARRDAPGVLRPLLGASLGSFLAAFAYVYFQGPSHLAFGGASGLSIVLSSLVPALTQGVALWLVNVAIVIVGLLLVDRKVVFWSIFGSLSVSLYVSLLTWLWPTARSLSGDPWIDLVCTVLLCSVGAAIAFGAGASTGGTDVLALALSAHTPLPVGKALTVANTITACAGVYLYGMSTGILCIVGLVLSGAAVEFILADLKCHKVCTVICRYPARVEEFIVRELQRTATVSQAYGAFTGDEVTVIVTVLGGSEAARLGRFLREIDPDAFVTYLNTSQITGRGFRTV